MKKQRYVFKRPLLLSTIIIALTGPTVFAQMGANPNEPAVGTIQFADFHASPEAWKVAPRQRLDAFLESISDEQKENLAELRSTLERIASESGITDEDVQAIRDSILAMREQVQGDIEEPVNQLSMHLALALLDGTLTQEEIQLLLEDVYLIVNSVTLTREDIRLVLEDIAELVNQIDITPIDKFILMRDFAAIIREVNNNFDPLYTYLPVEFTEQQLENLAKLYSDLEQIKSESEVTEEMVDQLEESLIALSEQLQSDPDAYAAFVEAIALARADGRLSWTDLLLLLDNFYAFVNASGVTYDDLSTIMGDLEAILDASQVDRADVAQIMNDISAIFREAYANSQLPKPSPEQMANLQQLASDLNQIRAESQLTPEDRAAHIQMLRSMADNPPSEEALNMLFAGIETLAADGRISLIDTLRLLDNVWVVLNSAGVTTDELREAVADTRELLAKRNIDREDIRMIVEDLEAIVREFFSNFPSIFDRIEGQVDDVYQMGQGWKWTGTLSYIYDASFPWIYSQRFGWVYVLNEGSARDRNDLWLYSLDMADAFWTTPAYYPYAYIANGNGWIYFDGEGQSPVRGYWVMETGAYIPL